MFKSIFLFLSGIGFTFFPFLKLKSIYDIKKNGIIVDATVGNIKTTKKRSSFRGIPNITYHHNITLSYRIGKMKYKFRHDADSISEHSGFYIGEIVPIYCLENNPKKIFIPKEKYFKKVYIITLILGIIAMIMGFCQMLDIIRM